MRILTIFLLPVVAAAAVVTPSQINAVINQARSVPPEFAADAMLRLAEVRTIPAKRRMDWIEQAFERAAGAQQPLRRLAAMPKLAGPMGYLNRVNNQDLDGLSLHLRAVEAMLPLDGAKARELFLRIPPLHIPALTCDDFMVFDVSRFYTVLGALVARSFTPQQKAQGEPAKLIGRYVSSLTSPVEVGPMVKVLVASKVSNEEFQGLLIPFVGALAKMAGDDRSFAYSLNSGRDILTLIGECKRRGISPLPVVESFRVYLVIHLSASRCADNDLMMSGQQSFGLFTGTPVDQQAADIVTFFNEKIRVAPLEPIQELEATPSRLEGAASGFRSCQDDACHAVAAQYRKLILKTSGIPLTPAERNTPTWRARLGAFLVTMAAWKPDEDTNPTEYYRDKAGAYTDLLNLMADTPGREPVMRALLDFVKLSPVQATNRLDWFLPVNVLIARVGLDRIHLVRFAAELRKVNNPVIALYANLELVAPRTPQRVLPLL